MQISAQALRQVLRYCPETGAITWIGRTSEQFPDVGKGGAKRTCDAWNTQYAGKPAFACVAHNGYLKGQIYGQTMLAHRVAWAIYYGEWPEMLIDHISGDKADNRLINLRAVTHDGNAKNSSRPKHNTSGCVGIYWEPLRNKWRADITSARKTKCLGRFDRKEDAIIARKMAEVHFGFHPNHGRAAP